MQISKAELARRLNSGKNIINKFSPGGNQKSGNPSHQQAEIPSDLPMPNLYDEDTGKVIEISKPNTPRINDSVLNTIIGSLAKQGEPIGQIASEFGLSKEQILSSRQATASPQVVASHERIKEIALDKLMLSLQLMTSDKFDNADLKTLSNTAANMSRVIEKLTPKDTTASLSQLIIYAPQIRPESGYKIIDV